MNLFLPQMISSGILAVILFILLLPTLSLTIRRLHDTERNGALILITVAPLAIMALISLLSVLNFNKPATRVSQTTDNGWRIIDVPDEYIAENGDILWDSIKDPKVIETYSYEKDGDIVMEPEGVDIIYVQKYDKNGKLVLEAQKNQTNKANDRRLIAGTAGIQSMLFLLWIISVVIMIIWCSQPGTEGPNKYGSDPSVLE